MPGVTDGCRKAAEEIFCTTDPSYPAVKRAALIIARHTRAAKLEEALVPFARASMCMTHLHDDSPVADFYHPGRQDSPERLLCKHFRDAQRILSSHEARDLLAEKDREGEGGK